jgi:hypothetical protein
MPPIKKSEHHYVHTRKQLELQAAALQQQLLEAGERQEAIKARAEVRGICLVALIYDIHQQHDQLTAG